MKDRKPKRLKEYRVKSDQSEGSQNDQNNNISSDSEDLNEDPLNLFYPNEDKIKLDNINNEEKKIFYKKIDVLYNIRKKSTINLIINYHRENIIKFGNITHKEGEIDYAQFKILYKGEKEKGQFEFVEYYILFEIFYKKLIGFLNKIRKITIQLFSRITLGNELLIKINLEEDGNNINADKNICNINSEYIFIYNSYKIKYQDKDILNGGDYKGFRLFSKEIIGYISNQTSIYYNFYYNNITDIIRDFNQIKKFNFKSFVKKVIINKGIAKKIRELDNGSFLCDGNNEIIQYNTYSKQFKKEYFKNYCSFFTDKNRVIIIPKNKIVFLNKPDGNYILFYENGIYYTSNNFNPISNDKICLRLSEMACRGGIKINDNFIAITSNRILSKGKNKLIFFNLISQKFMEEFEIENYSFTLSENNCSIMKIPKHENSKLLFAACKKYFKDDKNGILLVKLKINSNDIKTEYQKFYDTKNFEVYCFCPILKIDKKEMLNPAQKIDTGYFLVGGFDLDKEQGLIKLYKVIYYDEIEKIEIEYIHDIIMVKKEGKNYLEFFKGFKGPINCIIQSSQGEILVTCNDGNVYSFYEIILEKEIEDISILKSCKGK